jgi:hypothetical protein
MQSIAVKGKSICPFKENEANDQHLQNQELFVI